MFRQYSVHCHFRGIHCFEGNLLRGWSDSDYDIQARGAVPQFQSGPTYTLWNIIDILEEYERRGVSDGQQGLMILITGGQTNDHTDNFAASVKQRLKDFNVVLKVLAVGNVNMRQLSMIVEDPENDIIKLENFNVRIFWWRR